ncbi:MAG: hypothetical protein ACLGG9_11720 [Thermoleophilia bacterium]
MLERFLFTPEGRVRARRMTATVIVTVAFALFSSFLLVLTPILTGHEHLQSAWVIFSVFLLKFPLIGLLWWLIGRNKEWPFQKPKWGPEETRQILDYLVAEAERSLSLPDAPERLAYLQSEAWHVADGAHGALKAQAVDVAVSIGRVATRPTPLRGRRLNSPD